MEDGPRHEARQVALSPEAVKSIEKLNAQITAEREALTSNPLATAMNDLIRAYVSMLETARDRIIFYGGQCDSVETMERSDPHLRKAKEALDNARRAEPPDASLATTMAIVATMEKALRQIDDYSSGSTIQPVLIARDALRKLYGPNYRSAVTKEEARE